MSPLAVLLLRRIGLYALVLTALIVAGPPILTTFGVIGPSLEEEIDAAARSLQAARSYGAQESEANYLRGSQALERARQHAARRERWQSRRAIAEALESAVEAQRAALATREELRRSAQKVVGDIDRQLNELEDLYTDASKVVSKEETARLFGMMKNVRTRTAALFLASEEQNYAKVTAGENDARQLLAEARKELIAARAGRRAGQ
jgi:hypothetical protein